MRTVDCPSCGAHFALPEDLYERRVAGKRTRVRCKVCGQRVAIDGTDDGGAEELWVVSVGGHDEELSTSEVTAGIESGAIGPGSIAWKEGMAEWLALDRIEQFAPAVAGRRLAGEPPESPLSERSSTPTPSEGAVTVRGKSGISAGGAGSAAGPSPGASAGTPDADEKHSAEAETEAGLMDEVTGSEETSPTSAASTAHIQSGAQGEARKLELFSMQDEDGAAQALLATGASGTKPASPLPRAAAAREKSAASDSDVRGLFTVESLPPDPVDLDDYDMKSLPPSDAPPLAALRRPLVVPKAPRAPLRDLVLSVDDERMILAPPSVGALVSPVALPPDVAGEDEAQTSEGADEDEEVPSAKPALAPSRSAQSAATRWGRPAAVIGAGAVAIVLLLVFGLQKESSQVASPAAASAVSGVTSGSVSPEPDPSPERRTAVEGRPDGTAEPTVGSEGTEASGPPEPQDPAAAAVARALRGKAADEPSDGPDKETAASNPGSGSGKSVPGNSESGSKSAGDSKSSASSTSTAPKSESASKTAAAGGSGFDKGAAVAALTAAAGAASGCRRGSDPSGTATVLVTFAPSGRVTSANLSGPPFAGTATGGCIAAQMRTARVPSFSGGHVTVSKRVVIH